MSGFSLIARLAVGFLLLGSVPAAAQWKDLDPVTDVQREPDGVRFVVRSGIMKLQVCSDSIIRVLYTASQSCPNAPDYVVIKKNWPPTHWSMQSGEDSVVVSTNRLQVTVTRKDGNIRFDDAEGKKLFEDYGRSLTPVVVNGEHTHHAEMFSNLWGSYEAFYGLGQHQSGVWNYRGEAVDISQDNTNIGIPLFLSSNGYAIFWNNTSRSRFNNRFLSALYVSSEVADVIDYYFIYGPEFDQLVGAYRELTGAPP